MDEILRKLAEDETLARQLEELWSRGASAKEISTVIASKGFEVDEAQVEGLLAKVHEKQAEEIGFQDIDPDQFDKIAGGGSGMFCNVTGNCDNNYKDQGFLVKAIISDGKETKYVMNDVKCYLFNLCDEVYVCQNTSIS